MCTVHTHVRMCQLHCQPHIPTHAARHATCNQEAMLQRLVLCTCEAAQHAMIAVMQVSGEGALASEARWRRRSKASDSGSGATVNSVVVACKTSSGESVTTRTCRSGATCTLLPK